MDAGQIQQFEMYCNSLYGSPNPAEQAQANSILMAMLSNMESFTQLESVLANSKEPNALQVAATGLQKLITNNWTHVTEAQKDEMRNFLLNYLSQNGPELLAQARPALKQMIRLLARLTKLAWLEGPRHQGLVEQVNQFAQTSIAHWVVALEILEEVTSDMQPTLGSSMARTRRTALSFRDLALEKIFQIVLTTLRQIHAGQLSVQGPVQEMQKLLYQVLRLIVASLSFDFMGAVPDDTADDQATVMVPHAWTVLREPGTVGLFLDLYEKSCAARDFTAADLCLQSLVFLAALRKSFFPKEEDRNRMLSELIQGTKVILASRFGLENRLCYHALCRLLGKINTANQLTDLIQTPAFSEWIEQVYNFTEEALKAGRHLDNSEHYLITLWSQMASPLLALQERAPVTLKQYVERVTIAYIDVCMSLADQSATQNGFGDHEDPLENDVQRTEIVDVLASLGRLQFHDVASYVLTIFETTKTQSQTGTLSGPVCQKRITWLVYIIGALLGGQGGKFHRRDSSPSDRQQAVPEGQATTAQVNGELAARVFQLMSNSDSAPEAGGGANEAIELAFLYFLEQFRKIYIGEHAKTMQFAGGIGGWRAGGGDGFGGDTGGASGSSGQREDKDRLCTVLGLQDEDAVLGLVIQKIGRNLQKRLDSEPVIKKTLQFFHELAAGISIVQTPAASSHLIVSGRLLLKNEHVKYIIRNHSSPEFAFKSVPKFGKYRTMYYHILSKLFFMENRESKEEFDKFMAPMAEVCAAFIPALEAPDFFLQPQCREPLIGLMRDLRGVALACSGPESYTLLFNWMVDNPRAPQRSRIALLSRALSVLGDDHEVAVPLLKFMSEFVYNKSHRIQFDQANAGGILLFREVSNVLCTYGARLLTRSGFRDVYREKYKGIAVTLEMFSHALQGNYANFGVFEVYGDNSLSESMKIALNMCLAVPPADLQAYIKAMKTFYCFIELASRGHMEKVLQLETAAVAQLLSNVEEGLLSFENGVTLQCCATVDNFAQFIYHNRTQQTEEGALARRFVQEQPQSLAKILALMFSLIVCGELSSTWSISRPLLGLILLHPDDFLMIKQQTAENQMDEQKRTKMLNLFNDLMSDVENSLNPKNKDLFTRNLYQFAQSLRSF
uniref:Importin N-terminal domain-containing protein n=1 Tax=Chromera velia CCMP2878 TaxID=1169474 RepID=A0A0K6S6Y1_9ALVE|eukprot:Cvel_18496.t2-p1 / transcript=Cvel_18496.t2 / gene=Cvel_18496 / organism=Chromera_velia_CCMP2878 / gene_product=Exportin-7, putative / transcript_product=Exportin-7, putative / location=Cvel_scaffold1535:14951-28120(+) / protein_length=1127 / sequence_SO=supercontig / SO=protein_coding / is_pseudo=false